jgi:hypothetical protein
VKDELHSNAENSMPQSNVAVTECIDSDEEDTRQAVPGPLSKEARSEAQKLGNLVVEESERIARKFKKSRHKIMLAAGLSTRPARGTNRYNMFKRWYANNNPMKNTDSESIFTACNSRLMIM